MCMTIQITITAGTGGDNEKIVKKIKLALNRANIAASTRRNRNGSATLRTDPGRTQRTDRSRMHTEAQALAVINSLIKSHKLSKGQFKVVIEEEEKENDEEE